jgi:hypothetical protein
MSANGSANGHASHVVAPTTASEDEATATSTGEPKKPFKPEWPLLSWADTKQNISAISFVLGCVFALAMSTGIKAFSQIEVPAERKDRFWAAITGPRLGVYVALLVVFHMLEFLVTAIYNPKKVTARCKSSYDIPLRPCLHINLVLHVRAPGERTPLTSSLSARGQES